MSAVCGAVEGCGGGVAAEDVGWVCRVGEAVRERLLLIKYLDESMEMREIKNYWF